MFSIYEEYNAQVKKLHMKRLFNRLSVMVWHTKKSVVSYDNAGAPYGYITANLEDMIQFIMF